MKKSIEILGLPIISITEGIELGKAKSLVINPTTGIVAALAIDDGKWYLGAKLLPFSAITGLGEYAVTIENSQGVTLYSDNAEFEKLLIAEITVIGTKVLTKSGRILGKVTEILVDVSGKIIACEIEDANGEVSQLPAERVVTFGKEVLIVGDTDEPVNVAPQQQAAATLAPSPKTEKVEYVPVTPQAPVAAAPVEATPAASPEPAVSEAATDDSAKKFDDKHRKFLLGKKASRRIETDNGMVIVEQGGEITEEVIQKAKLAGKFVELSMSIS